MIPVGSIEFAMKVSGDTFSGQTILGGERNAQKIDGFSLGNSPLEYTEELVKGKSIIFYTTNGSKAIVKAKYSSTLLISSFINASAVANELANSEEIIIVCSGNNGLFSYEDSVCAGHLISEMLELKEDVQLDDASKTCHFLYLKHKLKIRKMLEETEHGIKLMNAGFAEDIKYAADRNTVDVVPCYKAGSVKLLETS